MLRNNAGLVVNIGSLIQSSLLNRKMDLEHLGGSRGPFSG